MTEPTVPSIDGDEARRDVKRRVQAHAWHESHMHHEDDRPSRLIVHSFAGGFGADWDLIAVIDLIDRADHVGWVDSMAGHDLMVVESDGERARVLYFEVPRPPDPGTPDAAELDGGEWLIPRPGDRLVVEVEGTMVTDRELFVCFDVPRHGVPSPQALSLFARGARSVRVVEAGPLEDGERACMYHRDAPRPCVAGLAVCEQCRARLVVPRPVRDNPQA